LTDVIRDYSEIKNVCFIDNYQRPTLVKRFLKDITTLEKRKKISRFSNIENGDSAEGESWGPGHREGKRYKGDVHAR